MDQINRFEHDSSLKASLKDYMAKIIKKIYKLLEKI